MTHAGTPPGAPAQKDHGRAGRDLEGAHSLVGKLGGDRVTDLGVQHIWQHQRQTPAIGRGGMPWLAIGPGLNALRASIH